MKYPKIQSLYKREFTETDPITGEVRFLDKGKSGNPLIIGNYSLSEFSTIRKWSVEEKVDGTNIRVSYKDGNVSFGGRTDNAQIPSSLKSYLQSTFTIDLFSSSFPCSDPSPLSSPHVILFGEGYGSKIQSAGGNYRKDVGFILFDVWINGWWLDRSSVSSIKEYFQIPMVPQIGIMEEGEVVEFVKSKPLSRCSMNPQMMEGVVCRSFPLLMCRNGTERVIFKLKCKDF